MLGIQFSHKVVLGVFSIALTAGCADQRGLPDCKEFIENRLDKSGYEILENGDALHLETGLLVTQCAVGQRLANFRCRGKPLKLSWDDAMAYASEVAEKTGETWRLPEKGEMPKLLQRDCINPAVNPYVFPDMEVANFWTGSKGLHQDLFRCSVYTYQGRVFCRQARNIEQPFLLVKKD